MNRKVCLDFDGVLYEYASGYNKGVLIDRPVEGAQDFCSWLDANDFDIVVSTCRLNNKDPDETLEQSRRIRDWFLQFDFPPFMWRDARSDSAQPGRVRVLLTGQKPHADVYVDDRGFRFEGSFKDVKKLLQLPSNFAPWHKKGTS